MANEEHLAILRRGVEVWNAWRVKNSNIRPDLSGVELKEVDLNGAYLDRTNLSGADLSQANLRDADLYWANLSEARLSGVNLSKAHLRDADLSEANLRDADLSRAVLDKTLLDGADLSRADLSRARLIDAKLSEANLSGANLIRADLNDADLIRADLSEADLSRANLAGANLWRATLLGADLSGAYLFRANLVQANFSEANLRNSYLKFAQLVETNLQDADLTGCHIYGISAWNLQLDGATQTNLVITQHGEPIITVDNLEVAQFIYLLLENEKIRDVIDTIGRKAVLILGRFTDERKAVLDAIRDELRKRDYLPMLFDFDPPSSQNLTETIATLAHLARFVIADITDAKSIPQELQRIVPNNPSLPVQPLILSSQYEYAMFKDFLDYHWVLMPYRYDSLEELLNSLEEKVVLPATTKAQEIEERRKVIERELAERGK